MRTPHRTRRFYSPETWAAAKADYMAGMSAKMVEATHGIRENTVFKRACRDGWRRTEVWAARADALAAAQATADDNDTLAAAADEREGVRSLMIADGALREALKALERGDAREAAALIKAGDAVGAFAEFVGNLKAKRLGMRA